MSPDPHLVPDAVLDRFEAGSPDEAVLKRLRHSVGGHRQRGGEAMMLRLRVPGGRLSLGAFNAALQLAAAEGSEARVHLTLRQDLQLYGIAPARLGHAVRAARAAGLASYASGGSTLRNVTCAVLDGGPFDPYPYALALSTRLALHPLFNALPRKFKLGFGGAGPEEAQAWLNDLGFLPLMKDGQRGFRVIAGGGLGPSPHSGLELLPWIPAQQVGPWAEAALELFARHAPPEQPQRNRFKFVLRSLGLEAARESMAQAVAAKPLDAEPAVQGAEGGESLWISPSLGDLDAKRCLGVMAALKEAGCRQLRISFDQRLLATGLDAESLPKLEALCVAEGIVAERTRRAERLVVCTGPGTCNRGLVRSQALGRALDKEAWPSEIHVSGCPNGCSQHLIAPVSLQGLARSGPQGRYPAYALRVRPSQAGDGLRFGAVLATWPARRVPAALQRLRQAWQANTTGEDWSSWLEAQGAPAIKALTSSWVEPQDATDYQDLEAQEPFEVRLGESECH